jgi:hypothetical protein
MGAGIDLEAAGLSEADFFEGEELEARLDAGLRACLGIAPADDAERAIRKDICDRNAPTHAKR